MGIPECGRFQPQTPHLALKGHPLPRERGEKETAKEEETASPSSAGGFKRKRNGNANRKTAFYYRVAASSHPT
jgi:hypothetical protein